VFNTMSREKENVRTISNPATLYVCGVTPYDTTHLGHARTYLVFDILQRYLAYLGTPVRYVQNVTDVDDPLIAKANELGMPYLELAQQNIDIFLNDMRTMNMLMPAVYPRATEEIPWMIDTIGVLMSQGMAYAREGSVYFRAGKFPSYGRMSRLDFSQMLSRDKETGEDPADPNKEDPLDFRLWQAAQPNEPVWESPWGPGRPGWHIECSTMASRHLGNRIDFHGGGEDLIFPHHCSEIAQSEIATGESPFVRYWMHVGMVYMDGEKMSKSLGNMAFVRDLAPRFGADALRWYLLGFPYREQFEYFESALAKSQRDWDQVAAHTKPAEGNPSAQGEALRQRALAALDDDLDTPNALAALRDLATLVSHEGNPGDRAILRSLLTMLGFRLDESGSRPS